MFRLRLEKVEIEKYFKTLFHFGQFSSQLTHCVLMFTFCKGKQNTCKLSLAQSSRRVIKMNQSAMDCIMASARAI